MKRLHTRYDEIGSGVTRDMGQRSWSREELNILIRMLQKFRWMFVNKFDIHFDFDLYALNFHLLYVMVKHIQIFEAVSDLGSSSYDHFNIHT